ncbi:hypothetical protein PAXRUDRAFT_170253 [Paxillus rubicundulus Ve08.2h10]|uniref:Uncharacterized protein n=1 Tax=Paxillus rubicundulus Ve08.2h10 TaxID=930991 RepID=A0A0D0D7P1_9AGAM|nr:hypothetical protein PAXRUDRAFT_170253 [Paxillus rubicundulus Ve08.2h10]
MDSERALQLRVAGKRSWCSSSGVHCILSLKYCCGTTSQVQCMVCLKCKGSFRTIEACHLSTHVNTNIHICHAECKHSGQVSLSQPKFKIPKTTQSLASRVKAAPILNIPSSSQLDIVMEDTNIGGSEVLTAADYEDKNQLLPESFGYESTQSPASTDDEEFPISQLWDGGINSHVFWIGGGLGDIFDLLCPSMKCCIWMNLKMVLALKYKVCIPYYFSMKFF